MKKLWLLVLLFPMICFGQDWTLTTQSRSAWTMAGIEGSDTITYASYPCTFTKKGSSITFSHVVNGKIHSTTIQIGEQYNYPAGNGQGDPPWVKSMEPCTFYSTPGQGAVVYSPTKKQVIRIWPGLWEYIYF